MVSTVVNLQFAWSFGEALNGWLESIRDFMYSYVLVVILIGAGIYFFVRTRGLPVRHLGEAIRVVKEAPVEKGEVSSFKALMVSTASRVGVGNIAGVSTAIALGGAGAVFWMWVIAILGSASAFIESTLAQIYKRRSSDGHSYGGPAYYIDQALRAPAVAYLFAVALIATYVGGFNLVAANTVKDSFQTYSFYDATTPYFVGTALAIGVGLSVFGGIKRLATVTAYAVPFMAGAHILACLVLIGVNVTELPSVFISIFRSAFDFSAIFGGFAGSALMYGIRRGLYSNEAGVGSAPNAAATASVSHPVKQGLVQMLSVWIDTMVICTATALAVLVSGIAGGENLKGAPYVQAAWSTVFGGMGKHLVTGALLIFAFTTLIGNYFYAEANLRVILRRKPSTVDLLVFRLFCCGVVFLGAIASLELAWNTAEILMGVMVLINIPAILLLGRHALAALSDYRAQKRAGKEPVFRAADVGLTQPLDYWQ